MTGTAEDRTRAGPAGAAPATADDVRQLLVAVAVYSLLTGLAYRRPSAGRRALGVFFAVTGLAWNGATTVTAPEQFPALARRAPWGWYRRAGLALTEPAPRAFGVAMTAGETAVAAAVLGRDPAARLGLLAVAAFALGTTPLGTYTLGNPVLAAGALHLARRPWPTAAFGPREPCRTAPGRAGR
ncbi:hypothetical protein ACI8AC_13935 [Geodermatophilus sp. SYSU D00758]